jgi:hypothetical protein|tara:strand:- start:60 stop:1415 length:1356 start_codon:yes stop_codon:yes gene_type:complete
MKIDLIQPRHNYASQEGQGHVYLPTSLLTAGARLLNAGIDVVFHDENIKPAEITADYVGFNLLGAPYIPDVIRRQEEIREESGDKTFLVGGQVVSGLTPDQLKRLFGNSTYNGNNDSTLASILGIDERELESPERTSLIPAYEKLDDEIMREYLSREFSFYVSQGCKKACDFCAADKQRRESYRDYEVMEADLDYLAKRSERLGIDELSIYMSNLDVFQNPEKLLEFAYVVQNVKANNPNVNIKLRGLSRVDFFLNAKEKNPESIEELVKAGFDTVGFGVDGWGEKTWKKVKKGYKSEDECIEAIRSAREDFGMTPEILMVFGHVTADDKESLQGAYAVTKKMVEEYGAIPRPHVAKDFIPGNKGWKSPEYASAVESLLQNPESFQSLDFTALPSTLTHADEEMRELAIQYFLQICELPGNTTQHVKPITPGLSREELDQVRRFNEGRFDR